MPGHYQLETPGKVTFGPSIRREVEVVVRIKKGRNRETWLGQIESRTGPVIFLRPWGWVAEGDGFEIHQNEVERIGLVASREVPAATRREVALIQAERRPYRVETFRGHAIEVDGALLSTKEVAARVGITPDAIVRRIKAHGPRAAAITAPRRPGRRGPKPSPYPGRTVAEVARAAGMNPQRLYKRLEQGLSPELALSPMRRPGLARVTYQGRDWLLSDLARHVGVKYSTLRSRLSAGLDIDRAVETPVRPRRKRETGTHKL